VKLTKESMGTEVKKKTLPEARGAAPLTSELEDLDLLSSDGPNGSNEDAVDLSATLDAFNSRIQRKRREQELADNSAEKLARARQKLLLSAMIKIRKSLAEVVKLDLGDRFHLELEADDWQGWPRLTVRLLDKKRPNAEYPPFQVLSHDRNARSTIEILYSAERDLETLHLHSDGDLQRIPLILKKCVRFFLDSVAEIVLAAHGRVDLDAEEDEDFKKRELLEQPPAQEQETPFANGNDFFVDDAHDKKGFLEKLPELGEEEFQPLDLNAAASRAMGS
jgi:hypothetical protein